MNVDNKLHSYVKAHVGNVSVYYMGTLHIDNGNGTTENYYLLYNRYTDYK